MSRWLATKIIIGALAATWIGGVLIAIGIQESKVHPYHPSPNMVTPATYGYPSYTDPK